MRFVNHDTNKHQFQKGEKVKAQVIGFVLNGNIYESQEAYTETHKGHCNIAGGHMIPARWLINHAVNFPEEKKHTLGEEDDLILDANFEIKETWLCTLSAFGQDFHKYYAMGVETDYGTMMLFFNERFLDKPVERFKVGDIFVGQIMLSGDV